MADVFSFAEGAGIAVAGAGGSQVTSGTTSDSACDPTKRNRKVQRPCDTGLYKERNRIERFFSKLKQFRRVATRYDKLLVNFMGFVKLVAIAIWLK